ncbi:hypothetical protein Tco_0437681, partial [Tanacetum coccineum]
ILQKVLEESLTDAYPSQRGPRPPVVFREPDTGKLQPLPEVSGKGKGKVGEEQAAEVLLNLQTPKKNCPADQYIFQRPESQPLPTPSVLAGPNLEHSEVEITDASSQPQPEHMD